MGLLTLLTDFGTTDWYVAAVRGTVLRLAPGTQLADISHEVPPGDVETASFLLAAAAPCFPAGTVHLAVVDPGVGSSRRILAVAASTADPSGTGRQTPADPPATGWQLPADPPATGRQLPADRPATGRQLPALFLAPDNGLLTPFFTPGASVRALDRPDLDLPAPGRTFHGRDRFAPAAAALLRGEPFESLGPEVSDPVTLPAPPPRREAGLLLGRVVHIDRYGNLVTDIPAAWLPEGPLRAEVGGHAATLRVTHYREIPPGAAGVLTGSLGTLELSLDGADLARSWQVERGAEVRVALGPRAAQGRSAAPGSFD